MAHDEVMAVVPETLRDRRVNNRRTRAVMRAYIAGRRDPAFDAVKYRRLPERPHLDVWVPHDEGERRLQAVLDAGGRLVSDAAAPSYWVVEDADGNRSCICTPLGRG